MDDVIDAPMRRLETSKHLAVGGVCNCSDTRQGGDISSPE
jgi:hypothetical protein